MKFFNTFKRHSSRATTAAIVTVAAIGMVLVTQTNIVSFASNIIGGRAFANPAPAACIKVIDGINVNNANANATVRLDDGCGIRKFVLKSYYAPNDKGGAFGDQQVLFAVTNPPAEVRTAGHVAVKLHVDMFDNSCFYQVDLVDVTNGDNGNNPIAAVATGGNKDCRPDQTHSYYCAALGLTQGPNRTVTISTLNTPTVNATFTGADINWGDGTTGTGGQGSTHQYAADNTYTVSVVTHFTYNGRFDGVHNVSAPACSSQVSYSTPPPTPVVKLSCDDLTATPGAIAKNGSQTYSFVAAATAENTTITKYTFVFGDTQSTVVNGSATTASASHVYAPGEYDAQVTVSTANDSATSDACKKHITVAPLVKKLTCDNLTATPGAVGQNGNQAFAFTASATAENTAITSYTFAFGDGQESVVTSNAKTASTNHTYAPGDYTARVTVNSAYNNKTSDACAKPIHVAPLQQNSSLVCSYLQLTPGTISADGSQSFTLTSAATKSNATISNYVFNFGDSAQNATITTDALTANTIHTYAPGNYSATVTINGVDAAGKAISAPASSACAQPVTVVPPQPKNPNISLTKTVDGVKSKQMAIDQHFVYQLVIKNTGEKDLTNAVVTDAAPQGVTLLSADKGSVANNSFSYTIETLAVGQSVTVNVTATIDAYVAGNIVNTACVDTPDITGQPDSCDTATVTVPPVVTPPTTPPTTPQVLGVTTLVNTGPGSVLGIFAAVVAVSAVAHRMFLGRKLSN